MIKLIVTDLDDTLLDNSGEINSEFYSVFKELKKRNILFAAASGRQYYSIVNKLEKVKNDIVVIAENGCYMKEKEITLLSLFITKHEISDLIKIARTIKDTSIFLCGEESAYIETREPKYLEVADKYFSKYKIVSDLLEVEDKILKISICDTSRNSGEKCSKYFEDYKDKFSFIQGSSMWFDIFSKYANKGVAVKELQLQRNISYDETMLFGDYLNDYEMLQCGHHSYAMGNAHPKIKKIANFIAKRNDENGVVETIKEVLMI